ncbi:MAG: phosphoribosylanthranilate isomerase [Clostridia bacterium]|nr:phosphoribosylanthranilate isomerase [Clostridia bacterium]
MTLIKLCGMMTEDDIAEANRLRPDMIGFIFVPNSRRYVPSEKAYKLRRKLDRRIKAAGVFVNEEPEKISRAVKDGIIDLIQLHGDEDDAYIRALREETDTKIIKAFRIRNRNDVMDTLRSSADMILFDSGAGEGRLLDWDLLKDIERPFILAGGLDQENVKRAVMTLRPFGVDVSSGIETDGKKDPVKMKAFIDAVNDGDRI